MKAEPQSRVANLIPNNGPRAPGYRFRSTVKYGAQCQHPKSRSAGVCAWSSVGEFDIPDTYTPPRRHANQPDIPRPRALLCRQHLRIVQAFEEGREIEGNAHEVWCDICNHPDGEWIVTQWVEWRMSTDQACSEMGVSHRLFYKHVDKFGLNDKRASKVNIKRALTIMMEKGMANGQYDPRIAVKAAETLVKMLGEPKQVNVDVKGMIGVGIVDATKLAKMSDQELADYYENLARELRAIPTATQKQLTNGARSEGGAVMDLPKENIRVVEE